MSAYVIGHITIRDPAKWQEYRSKVPETLVPWGGEILFRGGGATVLSGDHAHTDTVALRFPDARAARDWYDSPAYQALIPLRDEAAEVVLIRFD